MTPIHPTGWELTFDGDTISLRPSIGNWGFACESHYWISRNQIVWAERMSKADIARGRYRDQELTAAYFDEQNLPTPTPAKRRRKTCLLEYLDDSRLPQRASWSSSSPFHAPAWGLGKQFSAFDETRVI